MNRTVRQRGRIARVRRIQHGVAAAAATQAADHVRSLVSSSRRLAEMRRELVIEEGATLGATVARIGELAMRLDTARKGLGRTIENARGVAAAQETLRVAARRDQESAERLEQAAAEEATRAAERRSARAGRRRRFMTNNEGGGQ
jgi:hypothetical protein